MDVSVIILNYDTFHLTCNCIRSVLAKTKGCSFEIILVDNGSRQQDPGEFLKLFPEITLVANDTNLGFARGNNCGIEKAHGDYVLLLNSDTALKNDAVSMCLESIRKHTGIGVMGCRLESPDGSYQHNCQRFPSLRYKLFELLRLQKILPGNLSGKILLGYFFDHNSFVFPDWIWGTFFMFKRSLLSRLPNKKLADDFFMYVEDMQWCMDFRKCGYEIAFEPRAQVLHFMEGQRNLKKLPLVETNTAVFMKRNYSSVQIALIRQVDKWLLH